MPICFDTLCPGPLVSNGVDDDLTTYLPATGTRSGSKLALISFITTTTTTTTIS